MTEQELSKPAAPKAAAAQEEAEAGEPDTSREGPPHKRQRLPTPSLEEDEDVEVQSRLHASTRAPCMACHQLLHHSSHPACCDGQEQCDKLCCRQLWTEVVSAQQALTFVSSAGVPDLPHQ